MLYPTELTGHVGAVHGIRTRTLCLEGRHASHWTPVLHVVWMTGLEPAASWSQITHSTKLNYIQILWWAALDSNQECRSHGFTVRCVTNSAHRPIMYVKSKVGFAPTKLRWPLVHPSLTTEIFSPLLWLLAYSLIIKIRRLTFKVYPAYFQLAVSQYTLRCLPPILQ